MGERERRERRDDYLINDELSCSNSRRQKDKATRERIVLFTVVGLVVLIVVIYVASL